MLSSHDRNYIRQRELTCITVEMLDFAEIWEQLPAADELEHLELQGQFSKAFSRKAFHANFPSIKFDVIHTIENN